MNVMALPLWPARPVRPTRCTYVPCPRCPYVVLQVVRTVVVDHQHQVVHVQTATRHRGRNEDGARLVLEVRDRLVAILLVHAAVQRKTVVAAAQQVTEQIVRLLLLVHEDQDESLIVPLAQDLQQTRELLFLRAYFDRLRHLRSHLRASAHDNHHRLVQDAARQVLHMRLICGSKPMSSMRSASSSTM